MPHTPSGPSYEICPSCGFQFGVSDDDQGYEYEQWREMWLSLDRAISGDAHAATTLRGVEHDALRRVAAALGEPLTVTKQAATRVVQSLIDGTASPTEVQTWASLMRRGYAAESTPGPIRPIDVEFEEPWEDEISTVISRLDELGDLVDGSLTSTESRRLLALLGAAD